MLQSWVRLGERWPLAVLERHAAAADEGSRRAAISGIGLSAAVSRSWAEYQAEIRRKAEARIEDTIYFLRQPADLNGPYDAERVAWLVGDSRPVLKALQKLAEQSDPRDAERLDESAAWALNELQKLAEQGDPLDVDETAAWVADRKGTRGGKPEGIRGGKRGRADRPSRQHRAAQRASLVRLPLISRGGFDVSIFDTVPRPRELYVSDYERDRRCRREPGLIILRRTMRESRLPPGPFRFPIPEQPSLRNEHEDPLVPTPMEHDHLTFPPRLPPPYPPHPCAPWLAHPPYWVAAGGYGIGNARCPCAQPHRRTPYAVPAPVTDDHWIHNYFYYKRNIGAGAGAMRIPADAAEMMEMWVEVTVALMAGEALPPRLRGSGCGSSEPGEDFLRLGGRPGHRDLLWCGCHLSCESWGVSLGCSEPEAHYGVVPRRKAPRFDPADMTESERRLERFVQRGLAERRLTQLVRARLKSQSNAQ